MTNVGVGKPFINMWKFIDDSIYGDIMVFSFNFVLEISDWAVVLCGVVWDGGGGCNDSALSSLFCKFVGLVIN